MTDKKDKTLVPASEVMKDTTLVKKLVEKSDMLIFRCPGKNGKCENIHFRHAGYIELVVPWVKPTGERKIAQDSHQVRICTVCKNSFVWIDDHFYDVSDHIDLKAWEKTEKEAHQATGPGGQC